MRDINGNPVADILDAECVGDEYADHYLLDEIVCAAFDGLPKDIRDLRYYTVLHRNGKPDCAVANVEWVVNLAALKYWDEREAEDIADNLAAKRRRKRRANRPPPLREQRETKIMVGTNPLPVMQPLKTTLEEMEETA